MCRCRYFKCWDGAHEHPTQALLDMFTIQQVHGSIKSAKIAIVGDITHSRVVWSNIIGLKKLGAEVVLCGPKTLIPKFINQMGLKSLYKLDECLQWCDIAMALRIQLERQDRGTKFFPSMREYHENFGIKLSHLDRFPNFKIMHPGPINRGVEMESEVADHERAIILDQVSNGVAVRMAILYLLSGAQGFKLHRRIL